MQGIISSKFLLTSPGFNFCNVCIRNVEPYTRHNLYLGRLLRVSIYSLKYYYFSNNSLSKFIYFAKWNIVLCYWNVISLERLNLTTAAGKAKIVGTLIGIGGAMVLTFVKGEEIELGSFHLNLLHPQNGTHAHSATGAHTLLGSLCALASGISYALWLIIQVHFHFAIKPFSCSLLILLITCLTYTTICQSHS